MVNDYLFNALALSNKTIKIRILKYMADITYYRYNNVISPETKYIHLIEAIQGVELSFLLASLKGETFHVSGHGQSKISSKRWKE